MKVYLYVFSWLITLFIGLLLGAVITSEPDIALAFTAVAAVCSAPFIVIFCLAMLFYLKTKPSSTELHLRTFFLHLAGSILTVLVLSLLFGRDFPLALYMVIFGYFVVDSICFHLFIHWKHAAVGASSTSDNDVLDSPVDV